MGLESYLFYVEFENEIQEYNLDNLLISIGLKQVKKRGENLSDFRSYYYEMETEQGVIEAHSLFSSDEDKLSKFSLRFSILSPISVVDQTFNLLNKLNNERPIKVRDTEIYNHEFRRLRQPNVDGHIERLSKSEEKLIQSKCYIPIDANEFKQNKMKIMLRDIILKDNEHKAVIRGGAETFNHIDRVSRNFLDES